MPLLPIQKIQHVSESSPEVIRARLGAAAERDGSAPHFRGTVSEDEFELQLLTGSGIGPRPVVRGTVREWPGGASVDAEVSLDGGFVVETTLALAVLLSLVGWPLSGVALAVLGAAIFAVVRTGRRNVEIAAEAFRRELAEP